MADKDKAFRKLLADKTLCIKFLRRFLSKDLPPELHPETIAFDSVFLEPVSFITPDLKESISDVLYRIRTDEKEIYVYILVEHQSKIDYLMPYRLLSYMLQIWARYIGEVGERSKLKKFLLPPILPVVFYEGAPRWTAVRSFAEKVERAEDYQPYIPNFTYRLVSLRDSSPEELLALGDALGGILYMASPAKKEDFQEVVEKIRKLLMALPKEERWLMAKHFYSYWKILTEKAGVPAEDPPDSEEALDMIPYLEKEIRKIKKEGRVEGRKEGRKEGWNERNKTLAVEMLREGFAMPVIVKFTGLTEEEIRTLAGGSSC